MILIPMVLVPSESSPPYIGFIALAQVRAVLAMREGRPEIGSRGLNVA